MIARREDSMKLSANKMFLEVRRKNIDMDMDSKMGIYLLKKEA
jgi:hypothetical protein